MNSTKTIELLRKRNAQMQEEFDRLKAANIKHTNSSEDKKLTELIADLENIRKDWINVLEELNQDREEYCRLLEDLRSIRETFRMI